jgi:Xaa-Pro aminopeptidase
MNKEVKDLRKKFKKYNIDGYVVPKNDDYFTEYSKINRLKIISNFSGSAGLAIILKNKNYLFTDGRYTIQSKMESGKYFKIVSYEKIINCNLFKNLRLGLDPKLFTYQQIKNYFLKNNQIKFLSNNLIDEIKAQKVINSIPFFSLKDETVGENRKSKINKIVNYLKKNKADNLFVTAPENVAWILNIRGGDGPNSPIPNSRLIINKSKKILLITEPYKAKKLLKDQIIKKDQLVNTINLPKKILALNGKNFIIDNKSCSVFYENIIKSKFNIIKREDPTYLLKAIKNNTEINNMISSHIIDGVALTKFIYWIKKVNKKKITEVDAQIKLEKFRKKSNKYLYPSFETIAGAGENGAIVHYRAKKGSCRIIKKMIFFYVTPVVSINMELLMLLEPFVLQNQNEVSKIFTPKY